MHSLFEAQKLCDLNIKYFMASLARKKRDHENVNDKVFG